MKHEDAGSPAPGAEGRPVAGKQRELPGEAPCRWRPMDSGPRDGRWIVVHARPCGQPFGQARLMLARFGEPGSDELQGWNNERPSGWRGLGLGDLDPDGVPRGELLDIVPSAWLDDRARTRWPATPPKP